MILILTTQCNQGTLYLMRNFLNCHVPTDLIRKQALDRPYKIALRNDLGDEISYKNFHDVAMNVAKVLERRNGSGSVGVLCKDPIQMAIGIFGSWLSNKAVIPLRKSQLIFHVYFIFYNRISLAK